MARESTQLAVLGAGPGGYAAAFYAADLGMQVALVDMEKNLAASACIAAASRRRRCFTWRM
jgi:pyruvate/2-oxoglutarate dehydrogenase complex dihydrolipoamide dehydrogenase (E3) component